MYVRSDATLAPGVDAVRNHELSEWTGTRRILVAVDGSDSSAAATAIAVAWASAHGAELRFVHVVPPVDVIPSVDGEPPGPDVPHDPSTRELEILEEAAAFAAEHGVAATTALLGGSSAEEILGHADRCAADLIVMGSHGHGRVVDALLGSVSRRVLHAARCRVLVVRGAHRSLEPTGQPGP